MRRDSTVTWHAGAGRMLPVLALASMLAPAAGALEQPGGDAPPAQGIAEPPRKSAAKSIDRIVQDIEKKHDAKVVRREEKKDGERRILVLRLLSEEGRVWSVRVDAETGKEL